MTFRVAFCVGFHAAFREILRAAFRAAFYVATLLASRDSSSALLELLVQVLVAAPSTQSYFNPFPASPDQELIWRLIFLVREKYDRPCFLPVQPVLYKCACTRSTT